MEFFLSTRFIDTVKKPIRWLPSIGSFNKPKYTLQLLSIGIVCEDGREYYAISNEFDICDASEVNEKIDLTIMYQNQSVSFKQVHSSIDDVRYNGKSNKTIAKEVCSFIDARYVDINDKGKGFTYPSATSTERILTHGVKIYSDSAFDYALLCSLFGSIDKMPLGFPSYCVSLNTLENYPLEKYARTAPMGHVNSIEQAKFQRSEYIKANK